ncbi:MAG: ribonucleotide-diphosphate reductase subunit beta [Actinomycetota bacterium]|nr:ribonucleotide-diphosphate reductase subunit beta [Actinomycetota bacterium]
MDATETLLRPEEKRTNLFPIRYPSIWEQYKTALSCLWVAGEVDLSRDRDDWAKLNEDERHFVSMVLAFFANADGIVNDNLVERFGREVQIREARCFYDLQKTMENIHNEMYSLLIQTYIEDATQRDRLLHAVDHFECVRNKAVWAQRWIDSTDSFAERLVAFAVVEGIFFSGSFCAIFWLKTRGLMPGLCVSNTLISRDERMHQDFAAHLYSHMISTRLSDATVHSIVGDAVDHEKEFVCRALPVSLIGMNADSMSTYIEFVADRLLQQLGHPKLYDAVCPFDFMLMQGMETKTNFFESRESSYQKVGARTTTGAHTFVTDADF